MTTQPSDWAVAPNPLIEVLHQEGDDPCIVAAVGRVTVDMLSQVEMDLKENPLPEFETHGDGIYTLCCNYEQGECDDYGRYYLPSGWSCDFIAYRGLDDPAPVARELDASGDAPRAAEAGDKVSIDPSAAEFAVTVAEEWKAMFSEITGLEKYDRFTYGPAVDDLIEELRAAMGAVGAGGGS